MGTFAETANFDYRLLFAVQGKQFPFSVFRIYIYIYWNDRKKKYIYCIYIFIIMYRYRYIVMYIDLDIYVYKYIYIYIYIYIFINIYIYTVCCQFKQKTENGSPVAFPWSVFRLFIEQTEVCLLPVCLRRNKRKLFVCKRTKRTCPPMDITL